MEGALIELDRANWPEGIDLDPRIDPYVEDYHSGRLTPEDRAILKLTDVELPAYVSWTADDGVSRDTVRLKSEYLEVTHIAQARSKLLQNPWRRIEIDSVCDGCSEDKHCVWEWVETEAWLCEECYYTGLSPRDALIEFHDTYRVPMRAVPTPVLGASEAQLRDDLLKEELKELADAIEAEDIIEIADALADIQYIINGTALAYGIDLDRVFVEVHRSNMSKLGADGKPIFREDGKVLKGPHYFKPDIARVLGISTDAEGAA